MEERISERFSIWPFLYMIDENAVVLATRIEQSRGISLQVALAKALLSNAMEAVAYLNPASDNGQRHRAFTGYNGFLAPIASGELESVKNISSRLAKAIGHEPEPSYSTSSQPPAKGKFEEIGRELAMKHFNLLLGRL